MHNALTRDIKINFRKKIPYLCAPLYYPGGDVMNRSGDSCVYQFVVDGSVDVVAWNAQIDIQER